MQKNTEIGDKDQINIQNEIINAIRANDLIMPDYSTDRVIKIQAIIGYLPDIPEKIVRECVFSWDKVELVDGQNGIIIISKECFK